MTTDRTTTFTLATIGIGVAVGLGGQDYVAQNIDEWVDAAGGVVRERDRGEESTSSHYRTPGHETSSSPAIRRSGRSLHRPTRPDEN